MQNILGTRYENFFLPGTMWPVAVAVSLRTFTDGREMAAWVKALLGGRAKDIAFLQAPSGGQESKIP